MKNKSNITDKQLKKLIASPVFRQIIANDNDISMERLTSIDQLSAEEIEGIKTNSEYWMKNYSTFEISYAPQYEYEPTPIYIYGIRGLYLVKELDQIGQFFNSKKDAFAYANKAIKVFYIDYE